MSDMFKTEVGPFRKEECRVGSVGGAPFITYKNKHSMILYTNLKINEVIYHFNLYKYLHYFEFYEGEHLVVVVEAQSDVEEVVVVHMLEDLMGP